MGSAGEGLWADDEPERLATGAGWLEGPTWVGDRLLVSDIPGNRVLSWREGQTEFEVAIPDAEFSNGRTRSRDGRVYQCSHGRRGVEELHPDLTTTLLVDRHEGVRLNSPNDLVVARDGAIWFTDPPFLVQSPCYDLTCCDGEPTNDEGLALVSSWADQVGRTLQLATA